MRNDSFPAIPPPPSTDEERMDELHDVLSHRRRRVVLRAVHAADGGLSIDELAERIIRREGHRPADGDPADEVASVCLSLYHAHLPKLTGADLVEYDEGNRTVEYRTLTGEQ